MGLVVEKTLMDFVRHMDFATGRAFEITWLEPELDTDPKSYINELIRRTLIYKHTTLTPALLTELKEELVFLAGNFKDDQFLLLQCLLEAAGGDRSLLITYVRAQKLLPSADAHSLFFDLDDDDKEQAA